MTYSRSFADWLRGQIDSQGITKAALAERLGVARSAITMWTTGETEPANRHIAPLARALGVTRYEIYLRLGRVEPRSEGLDPEWDAFIQSVEADGREFRDLVLGSLQDIRRAWMARPRGLYAIMRVSMERLFEPARAGVRGAVPILGERLLYYDQITSLDGQPRTLILTAKPEGETYTVTAHVAGGPDVSGGLLRVADKIYQAERRENALCFSGLQLTEIDTHVLLLLTHDDERSTDDAQT